MVLGQMAFQGKDGLEPPAEAPCTVVGAAGCNDRSTGHDPRKSLGDPRLVLAAVPSPRHDSAVEARSLRGWKNAVTGRDQLQVIGPETLNQIEPRREAGRQDEARLGAEKQEPLSSSGQGQLAGLEGKEERPRRIATHQMPGRKVWRLRHT